MKLFKTITFLMLSAVLLTSFTQCSSSKKAMDKDNKENIDNSEQTIENDKAETSEGSETPMGRGKEMPLFIRDTYFQGWFAGQKQGGSGILIYFPTLINKKNYKLEKVYFRGMIGDMQISNDVHYANLVAKKDNLVMSINKNAEYGNTTPTEQEPFPFELKPNECMISYIDNGKTKYFQIYNIVEKAAISYPSAPPNGK